MISLIIAVTSNIQSFQKRPVVLLLEPAANNCASDSHRQVVMSCSSNKKRGGPTVVRGAAMNPGSRKFTRAPVGRLP